MSSNLLEKMFGLEGKVTVITGAAGGIGSKLAEGFADVGSDIVLCDINKEKMEVVAENIREKGREAFPVYLDLSSRESIKEGVGKIKEKYNGVDILINCAAINKREPILDVTEKTFEAIVSINLRGLYQLTQLILPLMQSKGGGKVINIGSINSELALGGVSVYGATKAAVKQLTMVMAVEWVDYNIQVNNLVPGFMYTELSAPLWEDEDKKDWLLNRIAMKRPGRPEELLGAAIYLASSASSYCTGQSFIIDGGVDAGGTAW